ncbi:oxidoreductase [Amylibacter marinus]|uniref:Oxidoreductase n=1 Tax=Amylibacter marinus TaxID=1475483 RepID=A0ABQ5VUV4_9RHOB|nr:Gfo/Idh/MocA family oxidoreductase [Amylibacter marinus]GLQ35191.1 oxidoreductase [Amylibacter marinus]
MIKVAIIGAGIGSEHLDGFREVAHLFDIRYLCDLDQDRAAACLVPDEQIIITDDLDRILADDEIDVIDVCLPPHLHFPITQRALQAGKHVICEKPLVASLAQCDQLIALAHSTDKRIFPVFQYRFGTAAKQLQALLDRGLAGTPLVATLETHWNRAADYYDVSWRGTWAGESGGAVLGHAIHNHDLLCHFMGEIDTLTALLDTRVNDIEVEDCGVIAMRMKSGALVSSSITLGCAEEISRLRMVFSDLTVESDGTAYRPAVSGWRFIARDPAHQPLVDQTIREIESSYISYAGFFDSIAQSLLVGESQGVSLADGRRSIELVTAIYQSARSGRSVTLPLDQRAELYQGWLPQ